MNTPIAVPSSTSLFFSPTQVQKNFLKWGEASLHQEDFLDLGVPEIDKHILRLRPSWMRAIIARPGNGKTSFAVYHAIREAQKYQRNPKNKKVVLYWSLDQQVEEIEAIIQSGKNNFSMTALAEGQVPLEIVEKAMMGRELFPLWYVGTSDSEQREQPEMTVENVYESIKTMETTYGVQVGMLVIDYIQIVPSKKHERNQTVLDAIIKAKALTNYVRCKTLLLVQANREIEKEKFKVPMPWHSEWSSALEQNCHQIFGIWRPWTSEPVSMACPRASEHASGYCWFCGDTYLVPKLEIRHDEFIPVATNLMIWKNTKQRFKMTPGKLFKSYFDPSLLRLDEIELERYKKGFIPSSMYE